LRLLRAGTIKRSPNQEATFMSPDRLVKSPRPLKSAHLLRSAMAVCLAVILSGCIIVPERGGGGYYHHPHHYWGY
jgi:hypothetical protein